LTTLFKIRESSSRTCIPAAKFLTELETLTKKMLEDSKRRVHTNKISHNSLAEPLEKGPWSLKDLNKLAKGLTG